jgi:hypothetical protein
MSTDQPYMSPEGMPPYQKPGMSTGTKVLLILGIIFLVLVVLCCGGGLALFWAGASYMKDAFSDDPQVVRRVTGEIVDIEVPDKLQPQFSVNMKVPISGERFMVMVGYGDQAKGTAVMLASFGKEFAAQGQAQMQNQMEQQLRQQGLGPEQNMGPQEVAEKEIEVRGEPVKFLFATAKDPESGKERIQVTGAFQGKTGPVMIMVFADPEVLSEEEIVEMIESIE